MTFSSPEPQGCPHYPALVLALAEPRAGGLVERVRERLTAELGAGAAARVCDQGDLRFAGALGRGAERLDPRVVRRWARAELAALVERHPGVHPSPSPALLVLVLADGEDAGARSRLLDAVAPLRAALEALSLPAGLTPRIAALLTWPGSRTGSDGAQRAAWLRDLAHLRDEEQALDAVFLVARSNYHPSNRGTLRYLSAAERDEVVAGQVALLASTSVLHEVLNLRRGRPAGGWLALGSAALGAGSDAQEGARAAWPWLHASAGDWGGWSPTPAEWALGTANDAAAAPMLVRCLYGVPSLYLDGHAAWEEAYRALPEETRVRLHRFAAAAWAPPPDVGVRDSLEALADEWVP